MSCGVTTAAINLAKALKNRDANVILISLTKNEEMDEPKDIKVYYLYKEKLSYRTLEKRGSIKADALALNELIRKITNEIGSFDLFLSNTAWVDRILAKCNYPNTHHIIHESIEQTWKNISFFRGKKYRCWRWFKSLKGRSLICVSVGVASAIEKSNRIKTDKIRVIYNTFDIDLIKSKKLEFLDQIPNKDFIIHVGRFCKEKRYDILFDALKMLPNITLVLLAKHPKNALELAKKHGVSHQVITIDFQQNPFPWIASAKLLVLSSETEGLGMVLIESLICGTPIVSTDCDYGPREILTGELEKYLVPINNPIALANTISMALTSYPNTSNAEILDKIDPLKIADQYMELCKLID